MLSRVPDGHMGTEGYRCRAHDVLYWPNMNRDIQQMVKGCDQCLQNSNHQQAEPLHPQLVPVTAWQRVRRWQQTLVHCVKGKDFLTVADYYSGYPEVVISTRDVIL